MGDFLVKKTLGSSVTLRVEGADEAEALKRAKDGDGTIIDGPEVAYEIIKSEIVLSDQELANTPIGTQVS